MIGKVLRYLLDPWWKPVLISLGMICIVCLYELYKLHKLIPIMWVIPLMIFIPLIWILATTYQLLKKHWWQSAITGVPLVVLIIFIIVFAYNFEKHTLDNEKQLEKEEIYVC